MRTLLRSRTVSRGISEGERVLTDGRGLPAGFDAAQGSVRWNMTRGCDLLAKAIGDLLRA